jgi:hypothetical protein
MCPKNGEGREGNARGLAPSSSAIGLIGHAGEPTHGEYGRQSEHCSDATECFEKIRIASYAGSAIEFERERFPECCAQYTMRPLCCLDGVL